MEKQNVLIYPSGAENAIEVYSSIKNSVHINAIGASGKKDHSELIYEEPIEYLPYIQEADFIEELNQLIARRKIAQIFPTHDTVALSLAENRSRIDCGVITSEYDTVRICRFKKEIYGAFKSYEFCPEVYADLIGADQYPIFAKPDVGEGSKGIQVVKDREHHAALLKANEDLIYAELLPGKEYTVDCFTDRHGKLLFAGPRERVEVKMGISFRSRQVLERKRFQAIAEQINSKLKFRGLWFFQLKEDRRGDLKLLEVSARVSGTMGYFRHKGVNLPLLSVFDAFEMNVSIHENDYDVELFRSTQNRYKYSFNFEKVYLDFDDTVIINDRVSIEVIALVYHCRNLGKKIILLTKHQFNIKETLRRFNISPSLFEEVIQVPMEDKKSDHIDPKDAIFIDNWHKERLDVSERFGIPVFDVDAAASLMSY